MRGFFCFAVGRACNANPIATEFDAADFVASVLVGLCVLSWIVTVYFDLCSDDSLAVVVDQQALECGVCLKSRIFGENKDWIRYWSTGAGADCDVGKRCEVVETLEDDLILAWRNAGDLPDALASGGRLE